MKKHSSPVDTETTRLPGSDGHTADFRMRSKLSFDRLVEMGRKMGMKNPLFVCHDRAPKATSLINGEECLNFST